MVVTADHGISFHGGDNRRKPTPTNLAEVAFTPLFIKFPGDSEGEVVTKHLTIADILPTVADGIGITVPWRIQGRSALGDDFEEKDTVRVSSESMPYDEALAQRDAALATQVGLFGTGPFDNAFFGLGPYEGLLGTNVSELAAGGGSGAATIDEAGSRLVQDLPEGGRFVPSPIEATLADVPAGSRSRPDRERDGCRGRAVLRARGRTGARVVPRPGGCVRAGRERRSGLQRQRRRVGPGARVARDLAD